jgi:hypothetical protein
MSSGKLEGDAVDEEEEDELMSDQRDSIDPVPQIPTLPSDEQQIVGVTSSD